MHSCKGFKCCSFSFFSLISQITLFKFIIPCHFSIYLCAQLYYRESSPTCATSATSYSTAMARGPVVKCKDSAVNHSVGMVHFSISKAGKDFKITLTVTASFHKNLGKLVPECLTILDFVAARDDGDVTARTLKTCKFVKTRACLSFVRRNCCMARYRLCCLASLFATSLCRTQSSHRRSEGRKISALLAQNFQ